MPTGVTPNVAQKYRAHANNAGDGDSQIGGGEIHSTGGARAVGSSCSHPCPWQDQASPHIRRRCDPQR